MVPPLPPMLPLTKLVTPWFSSVLPVLNWTTPSMVAVAASGVLGRYLYLQIPRSRAGDELSLDEAEAAGADLSSRLRDDFGLAESSVEALDELAAAHVHPRAGALATLLLLPWDGFRLRLDLRRFFTRFFERDKIKIGLNLRYSRDPFNLFHAVEHTLIIGKHQSHVWLRICRLEIQKRRNMIDITVNIGKNTGVALCGHHASRGRE